MNDRAKAISLARVDPQLVANMILALYSFAAALIVIIHLAGWYYL